MVSAKTSLQNYCISLKTRIDEKISTEDKERIIDKCDDTIQWLQTPELYDIRAFQYKLQEVDAFVKAICFSL